MTIVVCQLSDCMYNREDKRPENKIGRLCGATAIGIEKKRTHACCDTYMALPEEVKIRESIMGNEEHENFNIYVNGKLEVTTNEEPEVQSYIDTLPETSTYAVRDRDGVVIEKFRK